MSELTQNFNFLQPTNFKIVIDRKQYGNIEFFAQRVSHPGINIPTPVVPFKRISTISIPGDTLDFSNLTLDVIVDENLESYIEIYNWIQSLVESPYKSPVEKSADIAPEVDITVAVQSSHNNVVRYFKYIDCVPNSIGELTLESVPNDVTVLTFPISFTINYFEIR